MTNAVVIGGGFGGIAAALRLRAKNYQVTLLDRCDRLGGRAQVFEKDGYRHDAGPTVITAPFLFEELFALFGRRLDDYVDLVALDTWYEFYFQDGVRFRYGGTPEDTINEIKKLSPPDAEGYAELLRTSEKIYKVGFQQLAAQPFHKLSEMLRVLPAMVKLRSDRNVYQLVSRHLKHEKLRQAFSIQPLLVGGNPFDTTCIYNLIHFLERAHGVHFAMGGTGALVEALHKLMVEVGIKIELGQTVSRLEVEDNRVSAVRMQTGQRIGCDMVVSNADPAHLYGTMMGASEAKLGARLKTRYARKSMGLFVLFFGTNRQYPEVAHHTIWMGPRYKELLADIFKRKVLAEDFSIYLHRPTATDPSFAPQGHDSFYALVPVPNLEAKINWEREAPRMRDRVVDALSKTIVPGLEHHIRSDFWMTPEDFKHDYLSPAGAGFSIAPIFTQSAWFRFHNKAEGPKNLYLVGAGTHPGAGLPGVLSSAKVVDRLVPPVKANVNSEPRARLAAE
ncbi:phytoene desaturase family protein [Pseudovibrio sp. SPO723]|uniref:phytoene desaturase family protein n=1 Tax=Nesiotobacter zosterae TaxID=392721 RepID=UPI0029C5BE1B|nr:phytoene desaturase family protein [Pseudovibrio sp. SPO723]MDX5594257.1 phytoene desaturase family protein [Pseudovibrio sp. SPO723]